MYQQLRTFVKLLRTQESSMNECKRDSGACESVLGGGSGSVNLCALCASRIVRFKIRHSTQGEHDALRVLPSKPKHHHDSPGSMGRTGPRCAKARRPKCQTAFTRDSADTAGRKVHRLRGAFRQRQVQTQDENKRSHFPHCLRRTGTVLYCALRFRLFVISRASGA